jgi:hypothetical protein
MKGFSEKLSSSVNPRWFELVSGSPMTSAAAPT